VIVYGNPTTLMISFAAPSIGGAVPAVGAQYMLLAPHLINNIYLDRGTVVVETDGTGVHDLPASWVPSLAVDPLNSRAVNAFWAAGPRSIAYEDLAQWANSLSTFTAPAIMPKTFWVKTGNQYKLTGLGANLPPVYQ
jgi:hypothetical protein